jgi:CDP-diacylglycerol--glycerol-3-phosphate 3-phosphatidyltransferase
VATTVSILLLGGAALLPVAVAGTDSVLGPGASAVSAVGLRWLLPAATVAAFELWFCLRYLGANRPESDDAGERVDADGGAAADDAGGGGVLDVADDGRAVDGVDSRTAVYESLGAPNLVTLTRGALFAALAGFGALAPRPGIAWLPAVLYGTGCVLDAVDGFLARRTDRRTVLGAKLDLAFDTTGFLVAPVVAVLWGQLPVWYLSLSAARYLFKLGRGLRRRRGKPVYDIPDSVVRRPLAGVQMAFITAALSPLLSPPATRPLAVIVLAPSLAVFARDYAVVAGWYGETERA